MGARGPLPEPSNVRKLRGARKVPDPSRPIPGLPEPPEGLSAAARIEFLRLAHDLYWAGLISSLDRDVLGVLADNLVLHREAMAEVERSGTLVRDRDGNVRKNPAVSVVRGTSAEIRVLAGQLGLTPSGRVRLPVDKPPATSDPGPLRGSRRGQPEELDAWWREPGS
jgi:P27 family predicted phage terminase small subunit